ncbi:MULTISPECIES: ATP-binding protein [unclassified Ruminococcus]|uniref:ATP-binding protein n=1 Tax=unclassified Ruminococcus TaxID=2608920 RepID=UPI00210B1580|nr:MULTISPECIES: ATP-binding protein [unclassified Ruminococcus]MCQ4022772.1 hypothetical protein [Ruminococcus sp. zg-924]MCQ4115012.1 hypothetical protein [Ruminococcus sp. zg-921]
MNELSLFVLDLAENSVDSGAHNIEITVYEHPDRYDISVADDGCGMSEKEISLALNTQYSTKGDNRGNGLPMLKASAEKSGGEVIIHSQKDKGTRVEAKFYKNGSPVLGDINKTVRLLTFCHPSVDFIFRRISGDRELVLDTEQIKAAVNDAPNCPQAAKWTREYLDTQTQIIFGGAVNEING